MNLHCITFVTFFVNGVSSSIHAVTTFTCRKFLFNDGKSYVRINTIQNDYIQNKLNYIFAILCIRIFYVS